MNLSVLTFDYELFLGTKTGSVEKSIIQPTNLILEVFRRHNAKGIFFVDAGYLLKLKEYEHPDLLKIKKQLKDIIASGSSVELHIHPQWLDARWKGTEWHFDSFERFRLHSLPEPQRTDYVLNCVEILESITHKKVTAFRAGGWCIQPFSDLFNSLKRAGILLDSSVTPGMMRDELPHHYYHYQNTPDKTHYRFVDDPCSEDNNGPFIEYPVTTHYIHGLVLFFNTLMMKNCDNNIFGDGKGLYSSDSLWKKFGRIFTHNLRTLTVESLHPRLFKRIYGEITCSQTACLVMHPKTLTKMALDNLDYVCKTSKTANTDDLLQELKSE